jgi:tetratricopeptide (TPR) repeat protein
MLMVVTCVAAIASLQAAEREPIFVRWLVEGNPRDDAIRVYWERSNAGELDAAGEIDLGTMLFMRGYPKDAIDAFRRATRLDGELPEPWFRLGLVHHRTGDVPRAREAYSRCLDRRPGHGWCNFYRGLLEEFSGNPSRALELYRTAYAHAPELADPTVNPEVLYSNLQLGAILPMDSDQRFEANAPLAFMRPGEVEAAGRGHSEAAADEASGTLEPRPAPTPIVGGTRLVPPAAGGADEAATSRTRRRTPDADPQPSRDPAAREAPQGADDDTPSYLHLRSTSPEAFLRAPWWPEVATIAS